MSTVTVRYESKLKCCFTTPFEVGLRHLRVAFCDGTQKTFVKLARERIIYRFREEKNAYKSFTNGQRFYHGMIGILETLGYITLILPFIVKIADRILNKPCYLKGGYPFRTHIEEGGNFNANKDDWRKNPFDENGAQDPFYQGASWIAT